MQYIIYILIFFILLFVTLNAIERYGFAHLKRMLNAVSQLLNVWLFQGYEDESCSSHAFRNYRKNYKWYSKLPMQIIDAFFWFDTLPDVKGVYIRGKLIKGHCLKSYLNEVDETGFDPEMRAKGKE